ncbi:SMI1/KNR4 family protein [Bacillus spongiae]|uniref:SMI1/KNR4 family protein n=1 Tax=Bacillus spongiae TaxID=2683610 RepID=A0ABU8HC96_9BACI
MDYGVLKQRIETIVKRINEIGGKITDLVIEKPATLQQIEECERLLGLSLPKSFKKVLLEFSSGFNFCWFFPENYKLQEEFSGIFSGKLHCGLGLIKQVDDEKNSWVDKVFLNPNDEYDKVWHNKLAFYEVGNGDYIAFDLVENDNDASVMYLSHDDGEGHGYKLGENFVDFLEKWSRIGFVGGEDWQWLPFTLNQTSGLLPESNSANHFRELLQVEI